MAALVELDPASRESYLMMAAARRMSDAASAGLSEVHAQVGINLCQCPMNCAFCAFARCNRVFDKPAVLSDDEVAAAANV